MFAHPVLCRLLLVTLLILGGGSLRAQDAHELSDMAEPMLLPPPAPVAVPSAGQLAGAQSTTTTPYEISILFLYTPDAVRLYGSEAAVKSRIDLIVSFANTAYSNSGIDLRIVKAATDLVYYDNANTTATAFSHLGNKTHPAFMGVNKRRMETQADFVVLVRPQKADASVCGKAYFVGDVANPATDYWTLGGYAYAHVSINCYDFVLAHELGHIMGLVHSRDAVGETNVGKSYPYASGYRVANDFNTILASTKGYPPPLACCSYLPVFSSPAATCTGKSGVPKSCGVDSALSNGADAVKAINNIAAQLPRFSDDSDSDGMPDWFEHFWGLDRFNPADASGDIDGDGLTNLGEFHLETFARQISGLPKPAIDTDGDGLLDGNDPFPTINGNPVLELNSPYAGSRIHEQVSP